MSFNFDDFKVALHLSIDNGTADIFFKVGYCPMFKRNGRLIYTEFDPLEASEVRLIAQKLIETTSDLDIDDIKDIDLAYNVEGLGRFRVNIYREMGSERFLAIVMRAIPKSIKTLAELNISEKIAQLCERPGLTLVTGATGNGKTTLLAAMLKKLYLEDSYHIITLEDPIEFIHTVPRGLISHREKQTNFNTYQDGLKAALRESPDIIMVGEIRNGEDFEATLHAAEHGIRVFSSIHTESALITLNKIFSYYRDDDQNGIARRLAKKLNAIISVKLLNRNQQPGRIPAIEILENTGSVPRYLETSNLTMLSNQFLNSTDKDFSQTFQRDISQLFTDGKISKEVYEKALSM